MLNKEQRSFWGVLLSVFVGMFIGFVAATKPPIGTTCEDSRLALAAANSCKLDVMCQKDLAFYDEGYKRVQEVVKCEREQE